jgi:hypothetical protein
VYSPIPKRTSAGCKQSQPRTANSPALLALVLRHALECFFLPCRRPSLVPVRVCQIQKTCGIQKTCLTNKQLRHLLRWPPATAAHPMSSTGMTDKT